MAWTPILPSGRAAKRDTLEVVSLSLLPPGWCRLKRKAREGRGQIMKGTRVTRFVVTMVALCALAFATAAPAAGNLARRAERLAPLELHAATGFSIREYALETGVYYRWRIVGDGREEYRLMAPQLFANSWIDRVSAEDMAVEPAGLNGPARRLPVLYRDAGERRVLGCHACTLRGQRGRAV
jgi:hypothetical protein